MCDHCGCRSFAPIAELSAEHEEILSLAWSIAEAARTGTPVERDEVAELTRLLDVHNAKEEGGLYPTLLELGGMSEATCDVLEEEHRELRRTLDAKRFDRRAYYALAAHIEVEEMELFSGAMLRFDDEDWEEMAAAHERTDLGMKAGS